MARPKKQILPTISEEDILVEKLASIHCTMVEIAAVCGVSVDTLERRFADTIKKGRETGNMSLRRKQVEVAMQGSVAMLIWLGKQRLEQKDQVDITAEVGHRARVVYETEWGSANESTQSIESNQSSTPLLAPPGTDTIP